MALFSGNTFKHLRALAQELSNESVTVTKSDETQETMSRAEFILRKWAASQDFKAQQAFLELAFGKVPMINEISGPDGMPLEIKNIASLSDDQLEQIIRTLPGG